MQLKTTMRFALAVCVCLIGFGAGNAQAQQVYSDTVTLNIQKAEEIFLKKNLPLLANQYNIDINKAIVAQARVWDNPMLNTDQNIYDGAWFRHTYENGVYYGQVYAQVMQLIRTAGKIKKRTQLAQDNVQGAEAQFNDVLRNLRLVLATDMNNLAQLQAMAAIYQREIGVMSKLVNGMNEMLKQGDVSRKDNVRINALLFSLQNDFNNNLKQQFDIQQELGVMLQLSDSIWVKADAGDALPTTQLAGLNMKTLQDSAMQWRPDLALAKNQSIFQQHNIAYQKALAKPDVNVGVEYDRANSYVRNYWGLAISLPLPIFDRNKGNIAAAELAYKQSDLLEQQAELQVNKDVVNAWQKLANSNSQLNQSNQVLQDNYEQLLQNMVSSYRQRQVSLIEFIDFFDAYKETRNRQLQLIADQRNAAANLNYTTNKTIIKL